MFKMLLYPRK